MTDKKLQYMDGLRGIGAVMVYFCHFVYTFYYAAYSLNPAQANTNTAMEAALGKTPVNLIYNGPFAVQLFFVISGYVLCISYFKTKNRRKLRDGAAKRYLRLLVPIAFTNLMIFSLMKLGAYHNVEVSFLTQSTWVDKFNAAKADFWSVLQETFFGAFFVIGNKTYNAVLWTVPYLFLGGLMVYTVAAVVGNWKYRYVVYIGLIFLLFFGKRNITIHFIAIFSGYVLCDVTMTQNKWMELLKKTKVLIPLFFLLGIYLASYPNAYGTERFPIAAGSIYAILGTPMVVPFHLAGAFFLVLAVLNSKRLQGIFGNCVFRYLGKRSFSLFLVHFPMIATFSCWFFLQFYEKMVYGWLVLLDFILTSVLILFVTEAMYRYVEPLGKKIETIWLQFINKENGNVG